VKSLLGNGIIRIHPLFIMLLVFYLGCGLGKRAALIFSLVLLHEFGHLVAARFFQVPVKVVELLPFGGVVRLSGAERLPPKQEIIIALAGPLTSLALFFLGIGLERAGYLNPGVESCWGRFNLLLAGFNLLPGLPLDGGRVLRALLSLRRH